MSQDGVKVVALGWTALISTAISWLLLRWWDSSSRGLPELPWLGLLPMGLIAVAVLVAGWQVRRYSHAPTAQLAGRRQVSPQRARGTLVAAQAAALGGAVLVGWYLAHVLVLLPDADVSSVSDRLWPAGISALVAVGVAAAGMVAQRMCRIPPDDSDQRGQGPLATG